MPHISERRNMRSLLAANPNYFGSLAGSPLGAILNVGDPTFYEQLTCIGFQPQLERLEAIVRVKQSNGYSGDVCGLGSAEYVRFYLSYDGGATWQDQGVSSVRVHDIPSNTQGIDYAVTLQVDPLNRFCFFGPVLPRLRAILQWDVPPPPNTPNHPPIWGNVVEKIVQIDSVRITKIVDLLEHLEAKPLALPLLEAIDLDQQINVAPKVALSTAKLAEIYADKNVGPERFALAQVKKAAKTPTSLLAPIAEIPLIGSKLKANLEKIFATLVPSQENTDYEQLTCIGYNNNANLLEGVIHVRRAYGYSGDVCTAGSKEYVAFWADTDNNGSFDTYLGTAEVRVYDLENSFPTEGVEYAVQVRPTVDLTQYTKPCDKGAVVLPLRGVLSWSTPPSTTDPNDIPPWGNRVDTLIQLEPGLPAGPGITPRLLSIGDVSTNSGIIDNDGEATGTTNFTGMALQQSPFGGMIKFAGFFQGGGAGSRYRIVAVERNTGNDRVLTRGSVPLRLRVTDPVTFITSSVFLTPDVNGFYTLPAGIIDDNLLMEWPSGAGDEGQVLEVALEVWVGPGPLDVVSTKPPLGTGIPVKIKNTPPQVAISVDLGPSMECTDITVGGSFTGKFRAQDQYFQTHAFVLRPNLSSDWSVVVPVAAQPDGFAAGTPYQFNSGSLKPCGYSLTLAVWDWTNVNSGVTRNYDEKSIGFCIQQHMP